MAQIPTERQIADVLTKPLQRVAFQCFRESLGHLTMEEYGIISKGVKWLAVQGV